MFTHKMNINVLHVLMACLCFVLFLPTSLHANVVYVAPNLHVSAPLGEATVVTITENTFSTTTDPDTEGFIVRIGGDLVVNSTVFQRGNVNREIGEFEDYELSGSAGPLLTRNRITYTPSDVAQVGDTYRVAYGAEACTLTEGDCVENEVERRQFYGDIIFTITDSSTSDSAATVFEEQVCSPEVTASPFAPEYCTVYAQLTDEQKQLALASINPEEINAGSTSVRQQASAQQLNIASRISALHAGATGLNVAGLRYSFEGDEISGEWLHAIADSIGGSAGADSTFPISPWGFFINGAITDGKRDSNSVERGFKNTANAITLGADYRFTRELIAGIAYGINTSDINFDDNDDGMAVDTRNLLLYGTWFKDQSNVDLLIGFSRSDIDSDRYIIPSASTAQGKTQSEHFFVSLSGGYTHNIAALSFGPTIQITHLSGHIDAYEEFSGGGLELGFEKQTLTSSTLSAGWNMSYAISTPIGAVLPYGRFQWKHELNNQDDTVNGVFVSSIGEEQFSVQKDGFDREWYHAAVGISATFTHGLSAYIDYDTLIDYDDTESNTLSYGGRWEAAF